MTRIALLVAALLAACAARLRPTRATFLVETNSLKVVQKGGGAPCTLALRGVKGSCLWHGG